MSRETLPSGAWVEFQDGKTATEGQRRPLRRVASKMNSATNTTEEADLMVEIADLSASIMITSASWLSDGRKCTADDILDLLGVDYDALVLLVAPRIPAFLEGVSFDPSPDPKAPIEPSAA